MRNRNYGRYGQGGRSQGGRSQDGRGQDTRGQSEWMQGMGGGGEWMGDRRGGYDAGSGDRWDMNEQYSDDELDWRPTGQPMGQLVGRSDNFGIEGMSYGRGSAEGTMRGGRGMGGGIGGMGRMGGMGIGNRRELEGLSSDVSDRGQFWGKGPKGYKRSDERIREDVCETIARQGRIDASEVEVSVEGGIVRLTGTVSDRQSKRALEQMVEHLSGVDDVQNEIRVQRAVASPQSARNGANETTTRASKSVHS